MSGPPPSGPVPLSEVLGRTAGELRRCREIVLRIEAAVHALLDEAEPGAGVAADLRPDLQAIDLLDQRLGDLTTWVMALADATGDAPLPGPVGALLHDLRLADLRTALGGAAAGPAPAPPLASPELF